MPLSIFPSFKKRSHLPESAFYAGLGYAKMGEHGALATRCRLLDMPLIALQQLGRGAVGLPEDRKR